jgi:hypothetical protein
MTTYKKQTFTIGVFTSGVLERNDMYLKDYKGQLWIFLSYIIIVLVDCCKPIDKMMSC